MKTTVLKATAILLILAGMVSCGKKNENENENAKGNVAYAPCTCDDKPLAQLPFPSGEAYLFKDSIPNDMDFQIRSQYCIVFNSKTGAAQLTIGRGDVGNICEICNYPDFAKMWNIPQNGCKVYFEGIMYESCIPKFGIAVITYHDYILTILKKK